MDELEFLRSSNGPVASIGKPPLPQNLLKPITNPISNRTRLNYVHLLVGLSSLKGGDHFSFFLSLFTLL